MPFNVNDFKQNLINEGARPTLFDVQFTLPPDVANNGVTDLAPQEVQFRCKAAQLPASTVGLIEVPYFGRKIKVAGDRTFDNWNVTVMNDEDYVVRNSFERWLGAINSHESNRRNAQFVNSRNYSVQATVRQFGKTGFPIKTYKFVDAFPTSISAIGLDYEQQNAIEQFDVEFTYNYFTSATGASSATGTTSATGASTTGASSTTGLAFAANFSAAFFFKVVAPSAGAFCASFTAAS